MADPVGGAGAAGAAGGSDPYGVAAAAAEQRALNAEEQIRQSKIQGEDNRMKMGLETLKGSAQIKG